MGYSADPAMVRVDFFQPSGKWCCTEAVKWTGDWHGNKQLIHDAFAQSLRTHLGKRLCEMDAICLHPHHEYEHPIMIKQGEWLEV